MAIFSEHINQAKRNLAFLQNINQQVTDCVDWQVTVCFYSALHLVNAHISQSGLQYRRHTDVKDALNPYNRLSVTKLPENEYAAYVSLQSLSRRARYLVNEKDDNLKEDRAFLTYDKHLAKALRHLDTLLVYFSKRYNFQLLELSINCADFAPANTQFIRKKT